MELATVAQVKYINQLITDWELTAEQTMKVLEHIGATSMETLTKGDASQMIDTLKGPIGHIIRPEDYVGKNIYGEPIAVEPEEDEEFVEHTNGCLGEWEVEECVCGAYDAYLEKVEAKGERVGGGVNTTGNAAGADPAVSHDSDIPAVYRSIEYKGLNAGWVTRLTTEGHVSPLPEGASAYLLVGSNGEAEELREWCSRHSAPYLAYMIRRIYGV
jgi:hypothetical protein